MTRAAFIFIALLLPTFVFTTVQGEIDSCTEVGRVSRIITGLDLEIGYLHPVELDVDVISAVVETAGELDKLGSQLDSKQSTDPLKQFSDDLSIEGQRLKKSALAWSHEGMLTSLRSAGRTLGRAAVVCRGKD